MTKCEKCKRRRVLFLRLWAVAAALATFQLLFFALGSTTWTLWLAWPVAGLWMGCCCAAGGPCCCERAPGPATVTLNLTVSGPTFPPSELCHCLAQTALTLTGSIEDCDVPSIDYTATLSPCGTSLAYAFECGSGGGLITLQVGPLINFPMTILSCDPLHAVGSAEVAGILCSSGGAYTFTAEVTE